MQSLALKKRDLQQRQHVKLPDSRLPAETPGPHRLQSRPERPVDVVYRQQQEQQQAAENECTPTHASPTQDDILTVFKSLTNIYRQNGYVLMSVCMNTYLINAQT